MRNPDDVLGLYSTRQKHYVEVHEAMREIKSIYENKVTIDLPDMDREEKSSVPNLLAQGVDQLSGRIASVTPMLNFPSEKPGVRLYDRRAETARRVVTGWHQTDRLPLKMRQRVRHLLAYSMSPSLVRYDHTLLRPTWDVRNPLECFPSPETIAGTAAPTDVLYAYRRSIGWLTARGYGPQVARLLDRGSEPPHPDTSMLLLEYVDPDGVLTVLTGWNDRGADELPWSISPTNIQRTAALEWAPNPTGVMTSVVPTRISLSRPAGQFDTMIGMFYTQAKLMALEVLGVEKGLFPDTYLVGRAGENPRFIDGPYDGRTGKVNIVAGGDVKELTGQPGYMTPQTIDRLERNQRVTAGIPAEFGGESGTNIRTGRRGDAVLSSVIDFSIAEAQDIMAAALHDEDLAAIALAKHYDGSAPRSIYIGQGPDARKVTYVSTEVFSTEEHSVAYPVSGTDLNSLLLGIGQRVGLGYMSKRSGARYDPFIESPESEHDQIVAEGLEQALLAGIQQQAASGSMPPAVVGKVMSLVASDRMELAEAVNKVLEDAAAAAQEQAPPGAPPTADQMTAPAAAASLGGSAIPGPNQTQGTLRDLLGQLRGQQSPLPAAG